MILNAIDSRFLEYMDVMDVGRSTDHGFWVF